MNRNWDDYWCVECQEFGHPSPGTDEWDEFQAEDFDEQT